MLWRWTQEHCVSLSGVQRADASLLPHLFLVPSHTCWMGSHIYGLASGITEHRDFSILTKARPARPTAPSLLSWDSVLFLLAGQLWRTWLNSRHRKNKMCLHVMFTLRWKLCLRCYVTVAEASRAGLEAEGEATSLLNWAHFAVLFDSRAPHHAQMLH